MNNLLEILPGLVAIAILICLSGFFSASEAALFSLQPADRRAMKHGTAADRLVERLLGDPDRLLSAVLFCNLVVNLSCFALSSMYALKLERQPDSPAWLSYGLATGSLLATIVFGELVLKSLGVLAARQLARWVAIPISLAVRFVHPLLPVLQAVNVLSRRLLWPRFQAEKYLEINDLERAIQLSVSDAAILRQEQAVLNNIVLLSDIRVDEWMRPRTQFLAFRPPVHLADIQGRELPGGYLLVTEFKSTEIARAIRLADLSELPQRNIDRLAQPVVYLPWSTTVAQALEQLRRLGDEDVVGVDHGGTGAPAR